MAEQPAFQAYVVTKREGQDDFWLNIGAAFAHKDEAGYNVILQALPVGNGGGQCKIVLRPPKSDDEKSPKEPERRGEPRSSRTRER